MYLTRTEYDRGVNTFSPEGRCVSTAFDEEVHAFVCLVEVQLAFLFSCLL